MDSFKKNISCVCSDSGKTTKDKVTIEFNFLEKKIYWYCQECKNMNFIDFKSLNDINPLPKMRTM